MNKKIFLEAGQIVGVHGVRGEVKVQPWCDSAATLTPIKTLYFDEGARPVKVTCRPHKNVALVKLKDVDTVEQAEALRGTVLYLNRRDVKLPKGRYFICDLIGLSVVDNDSGVVYGECVDVTETGANNVYHLKTTDGKEVLIPAIPDVVKKVDIDGGEIRIFAMAGLFDDEI
ncbi:MAG: 16S rRNA processing protein RimM [Clostridia bacterium]|nr:16S rRNA processing protein RimM [Clostridia bacterium]